MRSIKENRTILVLLLTAFFFAHICAGQPVCSAESPALRFEEYVIDQAGLLQPGEVSELASLLADFDQKTTNQFLVVILPSLPPGESLELFSLKLAEDSKAGRAGQDNGLLLLILKNDRKIRIEVGTGLEEKITDGRAGRVIREALSPAFQEGAYFHGIKTALMTLINWVDPSYFPDGTGGDGFQPVSLILFLALLIILSVFSRFEQRRLYKGGYSQNTFGPVFHRSLKGTGFGGGFRGGGGGFRGGGAGGGW